MIELFGDKLLFDEESYKKLPEKKRFLYVYEWLTNLNANLPTTDKVKLKQHQAKLIEQLQAQFYAFPGSILRYLIAKNLTFIYHNTCDFLMTHEVIEKYTQIIKTKDDSHSHSTAKLCSLRCIGEMYAQLGANANRSYEDTVQMLVKYLKVCVDINTKCEILDTIRQIIYGLETTASVALHKELNKCLKAYVVDKNLTIRLSALECYRELTNHATFTFTNELDTTVALIYRSMENSNYEIRLVISKLFSQLLYNALLANDDAGGSSSQNNAKKQYHKVSTINKKKTEFIFAHLANGFIRNVSSLFAKANNSAQKEIKPSIIINREVRACVTYTYIELVKLLGRNWLERNLSLFVNLLLRQLLNTKYVQEILYSRQCINIIFRSTIGTLFNERQQINAAKEFLFIIDKAINTTESLTNDLVNHSLSHSGSNDLIDSNSYYSSRDETSNATHHVIICSLYELGYIIQNISSASAAILLNDSTLVFLETLLSTLMHSNSTVKILGAWCLRCLGISLSNIMSFLLDCCMNRLSGIDDLQLNCLHNVTPPPYTHFKGIKNSNDAILGYGYACASLLGGVQLCPLGIPHIKIKLIFNIGEELLQATSQNFRLLLNKISIGWLLLSSFMTLGSSVVKKYLPRMILLWKNSMSLTSRFNENEQKKSGALDTLQISLEHRTGALCSISSFLTHCTDIADTLILKRITLTIQSSLILLSQISSKSIISQELKQQLVNFRYRLFETLLLIPPNLYEDHFPAILREIVSEFSLADTSMANIYTSLVRSSTSNEDYLFESSSSTCVNNKVFKHIEDQLGMFNYNYALEYDVTFFCKKIKKSSINLQYANATSTGSLPLHIALVDVSIKLYGLLFCKTTSKHRLQLVQHFSEYTKHCKATNKLSIQMNIMTAFLSGLKTLIENKLDFGDEQLKTASLNLIFDSLTQSNTLLKCLAAESLGRLVQISSDLAFATNIAQFSFDKLKNSRDAATCIGYCLALGYLHRYFGGGIGGGKNLMSSVSILFSLSQGSTMPAVQVWAIHGLFLIADSGAAMFRSFIEPCVQFIAYSLINMPNMHSEIYLALGKLLGAIITFIGPELQTSHDVKYTCLKACSIMQMHFDSTVKAEAISCIQKLHLFLPLEIQVKTSVSFLIECLASNEMVLKRACISFIRQLCQKSASSVCEEANGYLKQPKIQDNVQFECMCERGFEGFLFKLLDSENDDGIQNDIMDILNSIVCVDEQFNLKRWIDLCKDVAIAATDTLESLATKSVEVNEHSENKGADKKKDDPTATDSKDTDRTSTREDTNVDGDDNEADGGDNDDEMFKSTEKQDSSKSNAVIHAKLHTRLLAVTYLRRIISQCALSADAKIHFQLDSTTRKSKSDKYLVSYLQDLIRVACISATINSDELKINGLDLLQDTIIYFSNTKDPEFVDHILLEQYQAQIDAALKPQFSIETSAYVTSKACEVCSTWINSGVTRNINDLHRINYLLVSSLQKLNKTATASQMQLNTKLLKLQYNSLLNIQQGNNNNGTTEVQPIYSELSTTIEKLAVITAWAEVYIVAIEKTTSSDENLLKLVQPYLATLADHWYSAINDFALLCLSSEYANQLPVEGGAFYYPDLIEVSRPVFKKIWTKILLAFTTWLNEREKMVSGEADEDGQNALKKYSRKNEQLKMFNLCLGISLEHLSNQETSQLTDEKVENILESLHELIVYANNSVKTGGFRLDEKIFSEIFAILYKIKLTHDRPNTHLIVLRIMQKLISYQKQTVSQVNQRQFVANVVSVCIQDFIKYFNQPFSGTLLSKNFQIKAPLLIKLRKNFQSNDLQLIINGFQCLQDLLQYLKTTHFDVESINIIFYLVFNTIESNLLLNSTRDSEYSRFESTLNNLFQELCSFKCVSNEAEDESLFKKTYQTALQTLFTLKTDQSFKLSLIFNFIKYSSTELFNFKQLFLQAEEFLLDGQNFSTKDGILNFINCLIQTICIHRDMNPYYTLVQKCISAILKSDLMKRIFLSKTALNTTVDMPLIDSLFDLLELYMGYLPDDLKEGVMVLCLNLLLNLNSSEKEIDGFILNKIYSLKRSSSVVYEQILVKHGYIKRRLEVFVQLIKRKEVNEAKAKSTLSQNANKNAPKIALKLDFSNFK